MHICKCVYVCVCEHVFMYMYVYVYLHIYIYAEVVHKGSRSFFVKLLFVDVLVKLLFLYLLNSYFFGLRCPKPIFFKGFRAPWAPVSLGFWTVLVGRRLILVKLFFVWLAVPKTYIFKGFRISWAPVRLGF